MIQKRLRTTIVEKILRLLAISVLYRNTPFIIGITGSVGKTTTKDMIAHILREHKKIWATKKNYNNEVGVPLTVLCVEKDINSVAGVLHVCGRWISAMIGTQYPDVLVVEMGVDRSGDMDYLLSIVSPDVVVLTAIAYAHSEFFPSIEDIAREKQKIVTRLKEGGTAIINRDDTLVRSVHKKPHTKIVSYGTTDHADFYASDIEVCFRQCNVTGLSFKLNYAGKVIPVRVQNVIAEHLIYAALAALAVADTMEINILEAIQSISDFVSSPGRMCLLEGKDDALIIDDTYNASPKAMKAAIDTLASAPAERKIAIVGDMLELGKISQKSHEAVAKQLMDAKIDQIFCIGTEMRFAYDVLSKQNAKNIHYFATANVAMESVKNIVQQGDIVLIKGSRGMHLEIIVQNIAKDLSQTL